MRDVIDFVVVNFHLNNKFDEFKKAEYKGGYSYLKLNKLL